VSSRRPFGTRDLVLIALLAAMLVTAKVLVRVPIRVPGHSGALWVAMLIVGAGWLRRPGAASLIGLIAGVLATFTLPGSQGLLVWVKYAAAGVGTDVAVLLVGESRLRSLAIGGVVGAFANLSKLIAQTAVSVLLGVPVAVAVAGLALSALSHVVFGAIGGVAGSFVLQRLDKSGLAARWEASRR